MNMAKGRPETEQMLEHAFYDRRCHLGVASRQGTQAPCTVHAILAAMNEPSLDVGAILAQLRAEVRAAHGLLDTQTSHLALGVDLEQVAESVAEVEALRAVSVHWPLQWQTPRERVLVWIQRVVRRALRFYLEPIVQQQNNYNAAVARAVSLLFQAQQQLAADIARLKTSASPAAEARDETG